MNFTKSELGTLYQYAAPTKEETFAELKEIVPVLEKKDDLLSKMLVENTIQKLEKLGEPECSRFIVDNSAAFIEKRDNSIRQRLAAAKAGKGEPVLQGHDLAGMERFVPETRHMVTVDILNSDSPVGFPGERYRLFSPQEKIEIPSVHLARYGEGVNQNRVIKDIYGWGEAAPLTGLLYCADCGGKMYVHRVNNGKRVSQYTCSQYSKVPVGTLCKTQHRIAEKVVLSLVSDTLHAITDYAKTDRAAFSRTVQEAQVNQQDSDIKKKRRRLAAAQKRAGELERLMCKIYEDNALGRLPHARYAALDAQYAKEQDALSKEITELEKSVKGYDQGRKSAEKFIAMIDKYQDFDTMTTTMLNEFVEKILVHERLMERKTQGQGYPARIYVKNFILEPEPAVPMQTAENQQSRPLPSAAVKTAEKPQSAPRKTSGQECGISAPNNTEINKSEKNDTDLSITPPALSAVSSPAGKRAPRRMGLDEMESCRELILENIDHDILLKRNPYDKDFPAGVVRSRLLKVNREHISYIMDSLKSNTAKIGNIKAYTLTELYKAPVTMGQYYTSLVRHDMAHGLVSG